MYPGDDYPSQQQTTTQVPRLRPPRSKHVPEHEQKDKDADEVEPIRDLLGEEARLHLAVKNPVAGVNHDQRIKSEPAKPQAKAQHDQKTAQGFELSAPIADVSPGQPGGIGCRLRFG